MLIAAALLLFLAPCTAFAYIDPGTSAPILTSIGAILLGIATFFGIIWRRTARGFHVAVWLLAAMEPWLMSVLLIAFCLPFGLRMEHMHMAQGTEKKLILIGMDGMDPKALDLLLAQGLLPGFAELKRRGGIGELATSNPPQSPVAWSNLATGKNPGEHGVFDFIERDLGTYLPRLSLFRENRQAWLLGKRYLPVPQAPAFWASMRDNGVPATILRWPLTFPAEPCADRVLAGMGVPEVGGTLGRYTIYTTDPQRYPKVAPEHLVDLTTFSGPLIHTQLRGPRVQKGNASEQISVPLEIKRLESGGVELTLEKQTVRIEKVGGWSDFLPARFSVDFLTKIHGIVKFHLVASGDHLAIYASSVEFSPENPIAPISAPNVFAKDLKQRIGYYHTLGMPEDTKAFEDDVLSDTAFLSMVDTIFNEREHMFWDAFAQYKSGLLAFVFDIPDRVQHVFWRENELDAAGNLLRLGPVITGYYIALDRFLQAVLAKVDRETQVLVISDHGFSTFRYAVDVNALLVALGYMRLHTTPSLKQYGELFSYVDWSATKAYSLGFTGVYLNKRGREPEGIVDEVNAPAVLADVRRDLLAYQDQQRALAPLAQVYLGSETYHGAHVSEAPDLVLGFRPNYRMSWQSAIGGVHTDVISTNEKKWFGDHLVDPSFVPGIIASAQPTGLSRAIDLPSYVLKYLGL